MKQYRLYVIDLDGTMYRGTQKIDEAPLFIEQLQQAGCEYLFLTNNSSKTPEDVAQHLRSFGIDAREEQVYTTSLATAAYIAKHKKGARVYMIGEEGLRSALLNEGCTLIEAEEELPNCDYVVIGIDRQLTYEKLAKAVIAVRHGASFLATNADRALPTERGLLPGNGSIASVVHLATDQPPFFIGKPESLMVDLILQAKNIAKEDVLMVGDNYETDIRCGIQEGLDTALVFTGYTQRADLEQVKVRPTYEWNTLLDWRSK